MSNMKNKELGFIWIYLNRELSQGLEEGELGEDTIGKA